MMLSRPGYDMKCPRGLTGGFQQHQNQMLVHRIIDGHLVCMDAGLAWEIDDAIRQGKVVGL